MNTLEITCKKCGTLYLRSQSDLDTGEHRFCSEKCEAEWYLQSQQFVKSGYNELRIIAETAVALLREGMASTGTSTLHYQKMREAVEILSSGRSRRRREASRLEKKNQVRDAEPGGEMIISETQAPPVGGMGGSIHSWERSFDPWHRSAFPAALQPQIPYAGLRKMGWDGLDAYGNVITFVADGTVMHAEDLVEQEKKL